MGRTSVFLLFLAVLSACQTVTSTSSPVINPSLKREPHSPTAQYQPNLNRLEDDDNLDDENLEDELGDDVLTEEDL